MYEELSMSPEDQMLLMLMAYAWARGLSIILANNQHVTKNVCSFYKAEHNVAGIRLQSNCASESQCCGLDDTFKLLSVEEMTNSDRMNSIQNEVFTFAAILLFKLTGRLPWPTMPKKGKICDHLVKTDPLDGFPATLPECMKGMTYMWDFIRKAMGPSKDRYNTMQEVIQALKIDGLEEIPFVIEWKPPTMLSAMVSNRIYKSTNPSFSSYPESDNGIMLRVYDSRQQGPDCFEHNPNTRFGLEDLLSSLNIESLQQ